MKVSHLKEESIDKVCYQWRVLLSMKKGKLFKLISILNLLPKQIKNFMKSMELVKNGQKIQ